MSKRSLLLGFVCLVLVTGGVGQNADGQSVKQVSAGQDNTLSQDTGAQAASVSADPVEADPKTAVSAGAEEHEVIQGNQSPDTVDKEVHAPETTETKQDGAGKAKPTKEQAVNKNPRLGGNTAGNTAENVSEQGGTGGDVAAPGKQEEEEKGGKEGEYISDNVDGLQAVTLMWSGDLNPEGNCTIDKDLLCPTVAFGQQQVLKCLTMQLVKHWDGTNEDGLTAGCMEEMLDHKLNHMHNINQDIQLARACSNDAGKLCSDPIKYEAGGHGGAIVACLRARRDSLQPACQQEVFRVMREAAYDFRLDAALHEQCAEEAKEHCNNQLEGEGRIVECLHTLAFDGMENEGCKKEIIRQMRETSDDIRLNYHLYQACNYEMQTFCHGIQPGDGRMQICLAEARDEDGYGAQCKKAVIELLGHLIEDVQQDSVLMDACAEDLANRCEFDKNNESPDEGEMLACLARFRNKLDKYCLNEVSRLLKNEFQNIELNPKLRKGCAADIKEKCSDIMRTNPDEGMVMQCLVEKRNELEESCKKVLFEERIVRNENIAYNMVLKKACAKDQQAFCDNVEAGEGQVLQCLMHYFEDEHMSIGCKKALATLAVDEAEDYRLNPQLQKACQKDAVTLCDKVCKHSDNTESCDGKVIECLEYHTLQEEGARMDVGVHGEDPVNPDSKVSPECQRELSFRTRMQAVDYKNNEVLADSCGDDAQKYCLGPKAANKVTPGDGRVFDCLFENFPKLSQDCQDEELKFKIVQSESVNKLPHVYKVCQMETAHFCSTVQPTSGHVLKCLEDSLEAAPPEFTPDCKEALFNRAKNLQKDYRFDWGLHKHCKRVAKKYECPKITPKTMANGKVFMCLVLKYDDLLKDRQDSKCAGEMSRVVRQLFFHYQKGAPVTKICDGDLENICPDMEQDIGSGHITQCLAEYFRKDESSREELAQGCDALVAVGKTQKPSNQGDTVQEKMLKKQIKESKDQQKQIEANLLQLTQKLEETQAKNVATAKGSELDQNTLIGIVALFGAVLLAAVVGAVWAVRKYLTKGYMVLKSGDV